MKRLIGASEEDVKEYNTRYKYLYLSIAVASLFIFSRLWYLQIIQGSEMRAFSDRNLIKESKIQAPRGLISDRESRVLVENRSVYSVTITPQYASRLTETAQALSPILGIPSSQIISTVKRGRRATGPFRPVRIKNKVSIKEIYGTKRLRIDHPGLNIENLIIRYYPQGDLAAQLFGYVAEISKSQIKKYSKLYNDELDFEPGDIVGKRGFELKHEKILRGKKGIEYIEVDARGRRLYSNKVSFLNLEYHPSQPGSRVELTIDLDLQKVAQNSMIRTDKYGTRIGSLIAMKTNGEILAWVSAPGYNPNDFSTGISRKLWQNLINNQPKPLRNKVIQDSYQPGSTFKPFVALAGLQEEIITPLQKVYSPGSMKYGRRTYHDAHRDGHGHINVTQAIERSSNIFFYKLGISLGIDKIATYAKLFGFGSKTNIELPNETKGLMPTKAWKKKRFGEAWLPGENLSNAIGQSYVEANALQMAKAYNTIAMDGQVYKPYLIRKITNPNNKKTKTFKPILLDDITEPSESRPTFINKKYFKYIKEGLKNVFQGEHGTARWLKIKGLNMAGKTGTSQVRSFKAANLFTTCINRPLKDRHHGWFVGYAPAENPEITIAAFAQHGCSGGGGAAPMFRDIALAYFEKYHPELLKVKK